MLHIEHDDDGGCFRLIDDGIGLCTSKSRNVLVRIRDALNAVRETGLVGLTVEYRVDTIPHRIDGFPRGVVLALVSSPAQLVVRLPDDKLDIWLVNNCKVIEPERPKRDTPSNEPPIGVYAAIELLTRILKLTDMTDNASDFLTGIAAVVTDIEKFLADRKAAQPVP